MSLVYDARLIDNSGIGTTIRGQLRELVSRKADLVLLGNAAAIHRSIPAFAGRIIAFDASLYSIREQIAFPSPGIHQLHIPHYNAPIKYLQKCSVTVHDLIHLQSDEFKLPIYRMYAKFMLGRIAQMSPCIFTVSETTRSHFLRLFPAARRKTFTTLNGIDHSIFKPAKQSEVKSFRAKYDLPESFLLAVGIGKKHKNLDFILSGLARFWREGYTTPLVLGGTNGRIPDYARLPFRENAVRKNVILLPHLPESELPTLYTSARALVVPSRLEGFGLPALEAMACGSPVISSSAGSLPEVCGDAALYFDPYDVESFLGTLKRFDSERGLVNKLAARGIKRAQSFNWKRNVDAMMRGMELTLFAKE